MGVYCLRRVSRSWRIEMPVLFIGNAQKKAACVCRPGAFIKGIRLVLLT